MPGQLIQALLEQKGWSQRVLAVVLEIDETSLNKIIAGKKALDAKLALTLSEVFDVSPDDFMDLQKKYELAIARIQRLEDPQRATRASLFGNLPIPEMIKRGWLQADSIKDFSKIEKELLKFFQTDSLDKLDLLPHSAKKTNADSFATPTQLAWVNRVKSIASEMLVAKYSAEAVRASLPQLKELMISNTAIRKVSKILAACGVRYVVVESLKGAKIDGVCLWLDDKKPVIGMSLRFDRIDNFWFVLRHELEHVIQGHGKKKPMLDINLQSENIVLENKVLCEEMIANEAAAEFCIPQKEFKNFIARKNPVFNKRDIIGFAMRMKIHPGIVAGQLRHHLNAYNRFTDQLVKIRSTVTKEAVTDGWGDIYPID